MQPLSKPIADLKVFYDAVVVGSGYGGGVAASRLARMGLKVAVLERGREFALGDFPDRLAEAQQQFQVTVAGRRIGSPLGLYDMRIGADMNVLVGCGLGGTSLINANVSLEPDARVWKDPQWPEDLFEDAALQEGFHRARMMLRPVEYPEKVGLKKLDALRASGKRLGREAVKPPINVVFERQVNHANVEQDACTLCGDCCAGCNVGAKTTVQMTYLPDAFQHGADIFTGLRVLRLAEERGRWRIFFEAVGHDREKFGANEQSLNCGIVVLAAGTLGSTEILLRSKERGLPVSDTLGERFTGNGDVLAFGYNNDVEINGIGFGHPPSVETGPVGPCITGLIDLRGSDKLEDGMVIEEGSIPSGLAPVLPGLMAAGAKLEGKDTDFGFLDELTEDAREKQSLLRGAYYGAVRNTQTFLVMAHDDGKGRMSLANDALSVEWRGVADQPVFSRIEERLIEATAATGGTSVRNPLQETEFGKNMISVHPLGGCVIARDRTTGVVNHKCQVFDATPSLPPGAVFKGLYVCDGSVVSRSLGVNPLLTITALAERAMIHLARDYGLTFTDAPLRGRAPLSFTGGSGAAAGQPAAAPAGVEFTERMAGFISRSTGLPHATAYAEGKSAATPCSFTVTVLVDDLDRFIRDPEHHGRLVGTVDCPALSADGPLDIYDGQFNLMRSDENAVETKRFDYRFSMVARDGREWAFNGYKVVRSDAGLDLWSDTTELFVDIAKGRKGSEGPFARGILRIEPKDFAVQLQTIKGTGGRNQEDRLAAVAKFGKFFGSELFNTYGGVLTPLDRYDPSKARKRRALRVPPAEVHDVMTADGKRLRLKRYKGGSKGPVLMSHGLGVSSLIFSIDTIDTNLLEFLVAAGYDCWLLDFRASIELPYAREQWTGDDVAKFDYPAAVGKVRAVTGARDVQMVVHCFGATTFSMAMLAGLEGVRSAVISQIATDYVVPFFPQRVLATLRAPALFTALGIDVVNARATTADGIGERLLDQVLRVAVPMPRAERNNSGTSTRISALYGRLYELAQLNAATLEFGLPEMFGEANIAAFRHLAVLARNGRLLDHAGADVYLPNVKRMGLPILFVHGGENACFLPLSTERAMARLAEANGAHFYSRQVIPGYGHIDCIFGKTAARDVFPHIARHLEATARAGQA